MTRFLESYGPLVIWEIRISQMLTINSISDMHSVTETPRSINSPSHFPRGRRHRPKSDEFHPSALLFGVDRSNGLRRFQHVRSCRRRRCAAQALRAAQAWCVSPHRPPRPRLRCTLRGNFAEGLGLRLLAWPGFRATAPVSDRDATMRPPVRRGRRSHRFHAVRRARAVDESMRASRRHRTSRRQSRRRPGQNLAFIHFARFYPISQHHQTLTVFLLCLIPIQQSLALP